MSYQLRINSGQSMHKDASCGDARHPDLVAASNDEEPSEMNVVTEARLHSFRKVQSPDAGVYDKTRISKINDSHLANTFAAIKK